MNKTAYLILLGLAATVSAVREEDVVTELPDSGPLLSSWQAGYLKVSESKSLYYVFVESHAVKGMDRNNDPVIVWFNGGPGCSSLLGLFSEHGPFIFDDYDPAIMQNQYPWSKNANLLYIESPAGVGYTQAATAKDTRHNDMTSSEDAFEAIKYFFEGN